MITKETIIKPVKGIDVPAITIAKAYYRKWKSKVPFKLDLEDYMEHGIVVNLPNIFWMGKVVNDPKFPGTPALFVRMAVGDLMQLLCSCPFRFPGICFCRRNEERLRRYDWDRLLQLAERKT